LRKLYKIQNFTPQNLVIKKCLVSSAEVTWAVG